MKDEVLAMFDKAYRDRSPVFGLTPTECVVRLSKMLTSGASVADIGCGDGRDSLYLLEQGFTITSIDLSKNALASLGATAKDRGLNTRLRTVCCSVMDWRPDPSSFDGVIGITILDHLSLEDHAHVLSRIKMAVKIGGVVALEMHSDRDPGIKGTSSAASEFVQAIQSVSSPNYLLSHFIAGWRILTYSDRMEWDYDHGSPHEHGFVTIVAQKEVN